MQASDVAKRGTLWGCNELRFGLGLRLSLRLRFDSYLLATTGFGWFILNLLPRGVSL